MDAPDGLMTMAIGRELVEGVVLAKAMDRRPLWDVAKDQAGRVQKLPGAAIRQAK